MQEMRKMQKSTRLKKINVLILDDFKTLNYYYCVLEPVYREINLKLEPIIIGSLSKIYSHPKYSCGILINASCAIENNSIDIYRRMYEQDISIDYEDEPKPYLLSDFNADADLRDYFNDLLHSTD